MDKLKIKTMARTCKNLNHYGDNIFDNSFGTLGSRKLFLRRKKSLFRNSATAQSCEETAQSCEETAKSSAETAQSCEETVPSCEETVQSCEETAQSCAEIAQSSAEIALSCAEIHSFAFLNMSCISPINLTDSGVKSFITPQPVQAFQPSLAV